MRAYWELVGRIGGGYKLLESVTCKMGVLYIVLCTLLISFMVIVLFFSLSSMNWLLNGYSNGVAVNIVE